MDGTLRKSLNVTKPVTQQTPDLKNDYEWGSLTEEEKTRIKKFSIKKGIPKFNFDSGEEMEDEELYDIRKIREILMIVLFPRIKQKLRLHSDELRRSNVKNIINNEFVNILTVSTTLSETVNRILVSTEEYGIDEINAEMMKDLLEALEIPIDDKQLKRKNDIYQGN